ncbi:PKD domain-containing protein, partial [Fulvivirga sp. RKSG066]|uniref:PKD domain-containing protein n=1 Tax=Fulvivirga aurantia TaxID=2529383 RepID=UPI0012BCE74F
MTKHLNTLIKLSFVLCAMLLAYGCSDDETDLGPAPEAAFTISSESELRELREITFLNESKGGKSFFWSFGDGEVAYGKNQKHTYHFPGEYTVTLEATANGKRDVYQEKINIEGDEYELYFMNNDVLELQKIKLTAPTDVSTVFSLTGFGIGLAYDEINEEFYYTDDDNLSIVRNSLSGSDETLISDGFTEPRDIALDLPNDRLFVNDKSNNQIIKVNLTNGSQSVIVSDLDNPNFISPEAIDLVDDQLYMTVVARDSETVWTCNTDGQNLTNIINYSKGGYGYALEIDKNNVSLYFDDSDSGSILKSDLNGENVDVVGSTTSEVYGIAINSAKNKIYWADLNGNIKEA